ncbi:MAG: hypothetical protein ACXVDZ_18670 [Bacteroidia bacterium]
MKKLLLSIVLFCSLFSNYSFAKNEEEELQTVDNSVVIDRIGNDDIEVTLPSVIFTFSEADIKLKFKNPNHTKLLLNNGKIDFIINGEDRILTFVNGEASFKHKFDTNKSLSIYTEDFSYNTTVTAYPMWVFFVPIGFIVLWLIRRMMKK